jgi:O-antigen ligase
MAILVLMILVMPFEVNPYLQLGTSFLGVMPDFTLIKLLGLVGFGWAMLTLATGGMDTRVFGSRQARLFLYFFAGSIVAAIASGSAGVVNARYLAFVLFLPFVMVAVRTQADLRRIVTTMALALMLAFPYALRQMLRYDSRFGTGLYESNYLGANLVLVIPVAFAVARQQASPARRRLWTAGALILVLSLLLTSSRGALLGLLVAGLVFAFRHYGVSGAILTAGGLALLALPTDAGQRAIATLTGAGADVPGLEASNRAHAALFWAGLQMIADNPLTGVGPFQFHQHSTRYSGLSRAYIGHNSYLEIGAEMGLPVLFLFAALLVVTFRALNRASRLRGSPEAIELAGWAEGFRTGLVGFLVAGFFISAQYEKMFWLTVFLSIVVDRLANEHREREMAEESPAGVTVEADAPGERAADAPGLAGAGLSG